MGIDIYEGEKQVPHRTFGPGRKGLSKLVSGNF